MSNLGGANKEARNSKIWASDAPSLPLPGENSAEFVIQELITAICSEADQFFDYAIEHGLSDRSVSNKLYKWEIDTGSSFCWGLTRSNWNECLDRKEIAEFYLEFNLTKNRDISTLSDLVQAEIQESFAQQERISQVYKTALEEKKATNTLDQIIAASVTELFENMLPTVKIEHFHDESGMYVANCIANSEKGFRLSFIIDSEFKLNGEAPSRTFIMSLPCEVHENVYVNFSENIVTDISEQRVLRKIDGSDLSLLRKGGSILLDWLKSVMKKP